ncbi:MAG: hypothetical protein SR1Q7_05500 [Quinella sp. 1Q7]|nr:hypothetical protein [Quinella sp. 1Q7]MBR2733535.1 hypothetical protein [Selenomonadaceae bacterium]
MNVWYIQRNTTQVFGGRLPLQKRGGDVMTKYEIASLAMQAANLVATLLMLFNS